ncbi:MAG: glycosyltransferase family 4 protein [Bdellovibrionota bacterium]
MKVLFLSSCVNGGGAGRSLLHLLKGLLPDIESIVVVPEYGIIGKDLEQYATLHVEPSFLERIQKSHFSLAKSIQLPWLANVFGGFSVGLAMIRISKLTKHIRPHVIYCNHMLAEPVGVFVGWITKTPVILHARNLHLSGFGRWFYDFLATRNIVKAVICNSKATSEQYLQSCPEKTHIIYNSIDTTYYQRSSIEPLLRKEFSIPSEAMVVGYAGRLVEWKGIDDLIQAFAKVQPDTKNIYLTIVGGQDSGVLNPLEKNLKKLAFELGVGKRVIFCGFKSDVRPYVCDFDVSVVPSKMPEPFGRVIIESLCLDVPVIVSAHGGAYEVIGEGKFGDAFAAGNVQDLVNVLTRFLDDPKNSHEKTKLGKAHIEQELSTARIGYLVSEILHKL